MNTIQVNHLGHISNISQHLFNFIPDEWNSSRVKLFIYKKSYLPADSAAWQLSLTILCFFKSGRKLCLHRGVCWASVVRLLEHHCLHTLLSGASRDYGLGEPLPLDLLSLMPLKAVIGLRGRSKMLLVRYSVWEDRHWPLCKSESHSRAAWWTQSLSRFSMTSKYCFIVTAVVRRNKVGMKMSFLGPSAIRRRPIMEPSMSASFLS